MSTPLVLVFTTSSLPEGEIVRAMLQDEGIPVLMNGADSPYRMGPVHLFVPGEFEVQARLVIDPPDAEDPAGRS